MKQSSFLNLNLQDLIKGLLTAIGGAVMAIILPSIQAGNLTLDWTTIWHTAVAAGLAYLSKNLFTPTPKTIQIDPSKTSVVDSKTKQPIIKSN
ncbi:MAG TPA: hypothetical protein VN726_22900 [Hanamia sp.]|nr:hypothetical protein [Hanamia sp.]